MEQKNVRPQEVDEDVIDLRDIYFLLRQKLWKLILAFVLGAVVAGVFTIFFVTPLYQSVASIYVVSASNDSVVDLTDLQIGTNLTADYEELLLSDPMMESVIQNLGLDGVTVTQIRSMISISNPSGSRVLHITATNSDPALARDIANEMGELAEKWLPEVMDSNAPNYYSPSKLPISPSSPSLVRNVALGALVFLVVYAAFVVVRYMMNDTIRSGEEFERYFNITPLTEVPEVAGTGEESRGNSNTRVAKRKRDGQAKKGA